MPDRCDADITLRDDEHRQVVCTLPRDHRGAHGGDRCSWTDETTRYAAPVDDDARRDAAFRAWEPNPNRFIYSTGAVWNAAWTAALSDRDAHGRAEFERGRQEGREEALLDVEDAAEGVLSKRGQAAMLEALRNIRACRALVAEQAARRRGAEGE